MQASHPKPRPLHSGTVYRLGPLRYWLAFFPLFLLLRLYAATWRIHAPSSTIHAEPPCLVVAWHSRSFVFPFLIKKLRTPAKSTVLISASRAAAWEVALFERLGLQVVRGSTTRRSAQALRELLRAARNGSDLCISPDGPRGPVHSFQKGALLLARKAHLPILLFGANASPAWRPHTWDRHLFPLPFARITVRAELLPSLEPNGSNAHTGAETLRQRLRSLNDDPETTV